MDIEIFGRREKLLDLREQLLFVEEERIAGSNEYTIEELNEILDEVIQEYRKYWVLSRGSSLCGCFIVWYCYHI